MIVGQLRRWSVTADVEVRLRRQEGRDQFIRGRLRIERLRTAEDQILFGAIGCGHASGLP